MSSIQKKNGSDVHLEDGNDLGLIWDMEGQASIRWTCEWAARTGIGIFATFK